MYSVKLHIFSIRLDDIKENSEEDLITWYAGLGNGSYRLANSELTRQVHMINDVLAYLSNTGRIVVSRDVTDACSNSYQRMR